MNTNWSLSELYQSFESELFLSDYNKLDNLIKDFIEFSNIAFAKPDYKGKSIEGFLDLKTKLMHVASRLADYCQLILSVDSNDRTALRYIEAIENRLTETAMPDTKFIEFLKGIDENTLDMLISEHDELKQHEFYIKECKVNSKYCLTEQEENIISKMETTGSMAWIKFQENVMSNLTAVVDINGEKKRLPFPSIRNMAYEKDEATRIAAYNAELGACEGVAKQCAAALNGIKGEVITVCGLRGYESPINMTLIDSRMDADVLDALISSMRENNGIFTDYFKKKAKLLGKDVLSFYDLFAPVGKADFTFSYEQAADYVVKQFTDFSESLGAYAKNAIDSGWIDVYPKEGKRDGAFCQNLHYLGESRFLLNFTGSFNDVLTLAHELGHGFHGHCLKNETYLNSGYPMPIAETASTLCETIVVNAALKTAFQDEALAILENDISSCAQVTVDILSRYIFETKVFEKRTNGSLSEEELCAIMDSAQKEAYGEGLNNNCLHKYMWVVKPHYYSAGTNFYNFPYAFGLLLSKGLYAAYREKGSEFVQTIEKMLAKSGRASLKDIAAIAGIDLSDKGFWQSSFDIIKEEIELFLAK